MADELTQEKWKAIFEVGGTDALWEEMQEELDRTGSYRYTTGYQSGRTETIKHYNHTEAFLGGIKAWSFSILGAALLIFTSYCVAQTSIRDGQKELAACATGNTPVCQEATMDCKKTFFTSNSRSRLYRAAYKKTTGHDLPNMEMSYEGD